MSRFFSAFYANSLILFICMSSSILVGCGSKYDLGQVSGVITLDEMPLADATVIFRPSEQGEVVPMSSGRTDASGKYSLSMIADDTPGAIVALHRVGISRNSQSTSDVVTPEELAKHALPEHDFIFEVMEGVNKADFKLVSKKRR